ncbi:MAG: hypothetical protein ACXQTO_05890 [Candidatus Syntropharchaeales archaeon]
MMRRGPDTYPTEMPGGSETVVAAQYLRRADCHKYPRSCGNANSMIGVLRVCSNRGCELMMSGWSRHPQCYNQKNCVLNHHRHTEMWGGFAGIVCARVYS